MITDQIDALRIARLPRGSCYIGSFTMLRLSPMRSSDNLKLCHGIALLTDGTNIEFGHSWIEETDINGAVHCYDYRLHGRPVAQAVYYAAGNVRLDTIQRYSWFQAKRLLSETKHYGPWSDEIFRAAHS